MKLAALLVWLWGWPGAPGMPAPPSEPTRATNQPSWVDFTAPDFTGDRRPHGGPDWRFATPRLPALSADGKSVLVAYTELRLGGPPNLQLRVVRVADQSVRASFPILTAGEFIATAGLDDAQAGHFFTTLAARVRERLADVEAQLAKGRWTSLAACAVAPSADDSQPPCSGVTQRLTCDPISLDYTDGALVGTAAGKPWRQSPKIFHPAAVADATYGKIPVRACFGAAWLDAARGVLVGHVRNECQQGGDGCIAQPRWYIQKVPPR